MVIDCCPVTALCQTVEKVKCFHIFLTLTTEKCTVLSLLYKYYMLSVSYAIITYVYSFQILSSVII